MREELEKKGITLSSRRFGGAADKQHYVQDDDSIEQFGVVDGLASASASEDENSSDTRDIGEDALHWLRRIDRAGMVVHIEADKPGVPLCYWASGTTLKEPFTRGAGIEGLAESSRPLCSKCIARVSHKSARAIMKLREHVK